MKKLFLILFVLSCWNLQAQNVHSLIKQADEAFEYKDFKTAEYFYEKAIQKNDNLIKTKYKYANCLRLNHKYSNAAKVYKEIYRNFESKYPLSRYYYALMQDYLGEAQKAEKSYSRFYKKERTNTELNYFVKKAKYQSQYLKSLLSAAPIATEQKTVFPFDTTINTGLGQFAPLWISEDSLLFCHNERLGPQVISYLSLAKKPLSPDSIQIDTLLRFTNQIVSIGTVFEAKLYYSLCPVDENKPCQLFALPFTEPLNHSNARPLLASGDSIFNNRYPFVSEIDEQKVLFFSSDRPGGEGKYDIWYCIWQKGNGLFGACKNAGNETNSPDNEIAPFYNPVDSILWFSSEWFHSSGGFDIFYSETDFPFFQEVQAAPEGLNSPYDDIYYRESKKIWKASFSSNRPLGENAISNCCHDLYYTPIEFSKNDSIRLEERRKIHLEKILRQQTNLAKITPLNIYFDNDLPLATESDTTSKEALPKLLENYIRRYPVYYEEFTNGLKGKEKELAGDAVDSFFFDEVETGSDQLSSFLKQLHNILKENYKAEVEIKAFSSPLNSSSYNQLLAKRRIDCFMDYISSWQDSAFAEFIQSEKLKFIEVAIGEKVDSRASDRLSDLRNSVYNPIAARERRISILNIRFIKE